jgi:hypothetical protein
MKTPYTYQLMLLALFLMVPVMAHAAEVEIALHKALYNFKMTSAAAGAGINGVSGQMYFEQDATCDAWTTEHRLSMDYQYAETDLVSTSSRYAAYEGKDGKQFSFNSAEEEKGAEAQQLRGSVEIAADGTAKAVYSRPEGTSYDLPAGFFLPTGHTRETIRRARAGENFFSAVVFDGTDADGPAEIGTFIGKKATPEELQKTAAADGKKIDAALLAPEAWHVRMAVFPLVDRDESAPAYEMDMVLHSNGIISHAVVHYKTFSLEQTLAALEPLAAKKCD